MIGFVIDPQLAGRVRVGLVEASHLRVWPSSPEGSSMDGSSMDGPSAATGDALRTETEAIIQALRARYGSREPSQIEGLQPARELYHRIGVDPTRLRPSSEALLRRILRGTAFPSVNSLVDTSNLCSVEYLLPIGLHDLGAVSPPLTLRRGLPGEGYEAIGKGWHAVEGRLTVADRSGPCGGPTSDSRRTMITPATERCLMVIYAPVTFAEDRLEAYVAAAAARIQRFNGGAIAGTAVLS